MIRDLRPSGDGWRRLGGLALLLVFAFAVLLGASHAGADDAAHQHDCGFCLKASGFGEVDLVAPEAALAAAPEPAPPAPVAAEVVLPLLLARAHAPRAPPSVS